ncbi:hypothetical protein DFQ26_001472, partial [Actinomortierella ambigua]
MYMKKPAGEKRRGLLLDAGVCLSGVFNDISDNMKLVLDEAAKRASDKDMLDIPATLAQIASTTIEWRNFPQHRCSEILMYLAGKLQKMEFDDFRKLLSTKKGAAVQGSLEETVYSALDFICDEIHYRPASDTESSETECVDLWRGVLIRLTGGNAKFELRTGELMLSCSKSERLRQKNELVELHNMSGAGKKTDLTFYLVGTFWRIALSNFEFKKSGASKSAMATQNGNNTLHGCSILQSHERNMVDETSVIMADIK